MFKCLRRFMVKRRFPFVKPGKELSFKKCCEIEHRLQTERVFGYGGGWGNRVVWLNWKDKALMGWKRDKPRPGDWLVAPGVDGKLRLYGFVAVRYGHDPRDMFFADMVFTGIELKHTKNFKLL